jgi:leucyl aminopeptidase (aminopeptidase T)
MRRYAAALIASSFLFLSAGPGGAQSTSLNRQFADKLAKQLLGVKHGDIVLVRADPTHMELAEEIVASIDSAGGSAILTMGSNRLSKLLNERVPARYDNDPPKAQLKLYAIANAAVSIDFPADPTVVRSLSPSRAAALRRAASPANEYFFKHGIPTIEVGNGILPDPGTAADFGVSVATLSKVFYSGLNADYSQIHADGSRIGSLVAASNKIHVTAPNGTDFTLAATGGPTVLNDGIVSAADRAKGGTAVSKQLPAGDVYFLPKSDSVNGTIVFGDARYFGTMVRGMTAHFTDGKLDSMKAASGLDLVNKYYAVAGAGRDSLAMIDFGTNRAMHVDTTSPWGGGPSMAGGYVTTGIGNDLPFGGSNGTPFFFLSNIPNATVTVDDATIIKDGELTLH